MKRKKNPKPVYLRVRLPQIRQTGGAHQPGKGGPHRRSQDKEKARREIKAELE